MIDPDPPRPPRLVGEVLRTVRLPNNIIEALTVQFCVTREDGGSLLTEKWSGRGAHSLLAHLASGLDLVPAFERVAICRSTWTERCTFCTRCYPTRSACTLRLGSSLPVREIFLERASPQW